MDAIVFFLIFILISLIIYLIIAKKEDVKILKVKEIKPELEPEIHNDLTNTHQFVDDIDGCKYNDGYENELMYSNNLKEGEYINLFKETEIKNEVLNNNQISFNPSPREQMKTLPFANIHYKCLFEKK